MATICLLPVLLCLCILPVFVFAHERRILTNDPDMIDSHFHQLELKIQSLTSQLAQQDNQMIQMQNTMHGLANRLTEKDNEVATLQSRLSEKDHQITNITGRIGVLQTAVATKRQGCQTGTLSGKPYNGHNLGSQSVTVNFNPPFERVPKVMWGAYSYDYAEDHNLRFDSSINGITTKGFTMTFGDRGDTILYSVLMNWIACPDFI